MKIPKIIRIQAIIIQLLTIIIITKVKVKMYKVFNSLKTTVLQKPLNLLH